MGIGILRIFKAICRPVWPDVHWRAHAPRVGFRLLLASTCLTPLSALAQDATWTGAVDNNWNTGGNWSSTGVPAGTAFFGTVVPPVPTTILIDTPGTTIETIRFSGTTSYTANITALCGCGELIVTGSGIVNNSSVQQTFNVDGGLLNFVNGSSISGHVVINNLNFGQVVFGNVMGGGSDTASAGSATIANTGLLSTTAFLDNTNAGTSLITNQAGGLTLFAEQSSAGNSTIVNEDGGQTFFGDPAGGGTDTASAGSANIRVDAAIQTSGVAALLFSAFTTAGNATIDVRAGGFVGFSDNSTGGNARFITDNDINSTVDFSFSAGLLGNGIVTAGSIEGGGTFYIGNNNLVVGSNHLSTVITGAIDLCACGILTKVGTGTLTFAASSDLSFFNGSLVINGGTVAVNADMSNAIDATANAGGTLAGSGIFPATFLNGGTLSPGNGNNDVGNMVMVGGLTFSNTGQFHVDVLPTGVPGIAFGSADFVAVATGPTAIAGTLNAIGAGGQGYTAGARYPVIVTAGALGGSQFDRLFIAGNFGSTRPVLTYEFENAVYIDLIQGSVSGQLTPGATRNQIDVAKGIDTALLGGANFGAFTNLYNLTGNDFLKALDQLSGEAGTGFQQAAYQSMGSFLNTMLNPFTSSRSGFGPASSYAEAEASGYAPRRHIARQAQTAMGSAMSVKAMIPDQRYSVWGAAFGGSNSIDADAVVGSHKTDVRAYGFAMGADVRVAPDALLGFALSGGRSSWGLAEGLGSGSADNFQAGVYGSLRFGAAYVSGALAYGAHWVDTKRNVASPGLASLESDYNAHSFGGRLETGYRFGEAFGLTPYAALQGVAVRAPGYLETASSGVGGFGVQYDRASDGILRTELGAWADRAFALNDALLTLRGRAAWAHDDGASRALGAAFPVLPGSNFTVFGAAPGDNLALLTAGVELKYLSGVSLSARFDSELSDRSRSYGGTGVFRYVW
jgi:uncharacterized protein with beta-barrel porin domain